MTLGHHTPTNAKYVELEIVGTSTSINWSSPEIDRSGVDKYRPNSRSEAEWAALAAPILADIFVLRHLWSLTPEFSVNFFALIAFHPRPPTCTPGFHYPESTVSLQRLDWAFAYPVFLRTFVLSCLAIHSFLIITKNWSWYLVFQSWKFTTIIWARLTARCRDRLRLWILKQGCGFIMKQGCGFILVIYFFLSTQFLSTHPKTCTSSLLLLWLLHWFLRFWWCYSVAQMW